MPLSDETLNAFIDAELSPMEMDIVRDAIAKDEHVAQQVEALIAINNQAQESLNSIDSQPLSAGLEHLRQQLEADVHVKVNDNVMRFPGWKKSRVGQFMPTAVAASVAAVFGFFISFGTHTDTNALPDWQAITNALNTQPSGDIIATANGTHFEARLSFQNQDGEYCRQFYMQAKDSQALQSIACRNGSEWKLRAAMPTSEQGSYQTASNDSALDTVIDALIKGDVITAEQEQKIISRRWKR